MKLTLFLLFSSYLLVGQNIEGTILDFETNEPIENVNIFFEKQNIGSISNANGKFNLNPTSKMLESDTLQFSIIGYATKKYTLASLKENSNIVFLSKKLEELSEITINTNHKLQAELKYKKLSSMPTGVYSFGSSIINNEIYVIGGETSNIEATEKKTLDEAQDFIELKKRYQGVSNWESYSNELQIYSIRQNTWAKSSSTFIKRAYHKVILYNNQLYILGGKILSKNKNFEYLADKIEVLNLRTNEILIDKTNPHQAINFASFAYQDNIIVMGGSIKLQPNGDRICTDKSHLYNITTGYWYELPKMIKAKEVNGLLIGDKIYLIGGYSKVPLTEIESYDLITQQWQKVGDLFYGIENPALAYRTNTIYIFNGGKMLTYEINSKILKEYTIDLNLENAQLHYFENNLYIVGGSIELDYSKSPSSGLYLINLNEFSSTQPSNLKIFD